MGRKQFDPVDFSEAKQQLAMMLSKKCSRHLMAFVEQYAEESIKSGLSDEETASVIVSDLIYMAVKITGATLDVDGREVTTDEMTSLVHNVQQSIVDSFSDIIGNIAKRRAESN